MPLLLRKVRFYTDNDKSIFVLRSKKYDNTQMPILNPNNLEFISRSPEQTQRIGARLGTFLKGGEVIALVGDLGTGKTHLAQGIGMGWGAQHPLTSPTFILVRRHSRPQDPIYLYHVDLYRIAGDLEIDTLGLDDVMGETHAICLIEWADRAKDFFPDDALWIELYWVDDLRRSLIFRATGPQHAALLNQLRKEIVGR